MDETALEHRLIALGPGPSQPCPYLPGRSARSIAFLALRLRPGSYRSLMERNFRRNGVIVYRPRCEACHECQALRVLVDEFRPTRAQRRCWRRNGDLQVEIARPVPTQEKEDLYRRYVAARHGRTEDDPTTGFDFLYASPVETRELTARLDGRLVAVALLDVEPGAASTVYCYFDPDHSARSPGVFNILWSIDYCRRRRIPHLYLGYYIRDCSKMNYKRLYRPCELLGTDGRWRRM